VILYCIVTAAINALASIVLGLAVYVKEKKEGRNYGFPWFAATVAAWSAFYLGWQLAPDDATALAWCRFFTAAAILPPITYFHFVTRVLRLRWPRMVWAGYAAALLFAALSPSSWLVAGVTPRAGFPFWPVPGLLYPLYLLVFFAYVVAAVALLYRGLQTSEGLRRNQLRFVLLGTAVGFCGGSTNFFLWYNIPIPPIGNGLVAFYVLCVGYAIIRFRLMEVNVLIARISVYAVMVLLLALFAPGLVWTLAHLPLAAGTYGALMPVVFASVIATAFLFMFAPALRRRIDGFVEQRVLGDRLANRELLRSLAAQISSAEDDAMLYNEVVAGVSDALDVVDVAIYTRTEFETDYTRRAVSPHSIRSAETFPDASLLIRTLQESHRSVLLDEVEYGAAGTKSDYFFELRRKQGIELAVPVVGDTFFYGFITLGPRRSHALFNDTDVTLLEAIGLQIGLSLRARQLERRASQTEKLISLGTLAAGLAHELRNPLTSIQTFSALMQERAGDADFQIEFGDVVRRDVNRIASIVENVAAFAESNKVEMTAVHLSDVLRTVSEIARPESQRTGAKIMMPERTVPPVRGNHSQLLQVFLNLVQNAQQAMEGRPDAAITLGFEARLAEGPAPMICVTVADNGPGIDPALLPHIFEPFTTTKATGERRGKHGMGLGLAIVKRIVQHHHGEINVTSQPGRGTTFRVYLPQHV
jgi:two-component system nitrogen regulation sensor histidine kinase GlnL